MKSETVGTLIGSRTARRNFLRQLGGTGLAVAGVAALGGNARAQSGGALTDVDILNFALNLEYLEAEFYTVATTGKTIQQIGIGITGTGQMGETTGGEAVHFSHRNDMGKIAAEIAYDEQQHVLLLRSALGSAAVAKPAIKLDALGIGFMHARDFLVLARAFEDVGVSAYGGAAPLITDKGILATAARIALTEALHAGNLRLQVADDEVFTAPLDAQDILPPPAGPQYFAVDSKALAVVRTPSQVLSIVYANKASATSAGGFFPNGVNGTLHSVT